MEKDIIQIRIGKEEKMRFKQYCRSRNTTMSTIVLDYINTLISETKENINRDYKDRGILPGEEKNSVKKTSKSLKHVYCGCGIDLTNLSTQDRLVHIQTCPACQNV